jgi:hypothetical protein
MADDLFAQLRACMEDARAIGRDPLPDATILNQKLLDSMERNIASSPPSSMESIEEMLMLFKLGSGQEGIKLDSAYDRLLEIVRSKNPNRVEEDHFTEINLPETPGSGKSVRHYRNTSAEILLKFNEGSAELQFPRLPPGGPACTFDSPEDAQTAFDRAVLMAEEGKDSAAILSVLRQKI